MERTQSAGTHAGAGTDRERPGAGAVQDAGTPSPEQHTLWRSAAQSQAEHAAGLVALLRLQLAARWQSVE